MNEQASPTQGKSDPVEVRAAEIAKREGRDTTTQEDLERAYKELRQMGAVAAKPTP